MDQDDSQETRLKNERLKKRLDEILDRIETRLAGFGMRLKLLEIDRAQETARPEVFQGYRVPVIEPVDTMHSISQPTWEIRPRY